MASRTRWTWVWVNSRRWWWTGRPGMLRFMGSQRVRHNWVTELNWCSIALYNIALYFHQKSQVLFLLWLSSFFLELFLHWYPITYWAPTHLGSSSFGVLPFCLVILFMGFKERNIEVVCHSLFQWTAFCQNSPPWPIRLGWPYTAWLVVSLSYTRLWSVWSDWLLFCDCDFHSVCPLMDKDKMSSSL